MITLQKKETVKVYQVAMELLTQTKQSPFIAILILAKELEGHLTPEMLREKLFPNLPLATCRNLLKRLELEGYFKYEESNNMYFFCSGETKRDAGFSLTLKGQQSAIDQSIWTGEKGIYDVYITENALLAQSIIGIELVKSHPVDDRTQQSQKTPPELSSYENRNIEVSGTNYRIEKIEDKCFSRLDEATITLTAKPSQKVDLSIKAKNLEFKQEIDFYFATLEHNLLRAHFQNNFESGCVVADFDANNLLFTRDVENDSFYQKAKLETIDYLTF